MSGSLYGSYGGMPPMYGSIGGVNQYPGAEMSYAAPSQPIYQTQSFVQPTTISQPVQYVQQPVQYVQPQPTVSYTTQEIQAPRTYMEEVTKTVQVPKTVMEDHEVEYQEPKIEMVSRTVQVRRFVNVHVLGVQ
jgi:hypothetical protein